MFIHDNISTISIYTAKQGERKGEKEGERERTNILYIQLQYFATKQAKKRKKTQLQFN